MTRQDMYVKHSSNQKVLRDRATNSYLLLFILKLLVFFFKCSSQFSKAQSNIFRFHLLSNQQPKTQRLFIHAIHEKEKLQIVTFKKLEPANFLNLAWKMNNMIDPLSKVDGFIFWGPWMSVSNFMVIHPICVEIFQWQPKRWSQTRSAGVCRHRIHSDLNESKLNSNTGLLWIWICYYSINLCFPVKYGWHW